MVQYLVQRVAPKVMVAKTSAPRSFFSSRRIHILYRRQCAKVRTLLLSIVLIHPTFTVVWSFNDFTSLSKRKCLGYSGHFGKSSPKISLVIATRDMHSRGAKLVVFLEVPTAEDNLNFYLSKPRLKKTGVLWSLVWSPNGVIFKVKNSTGLYLHPCCIKWLLQPNKWCIDVALKGYYIIMNSSLITKRFVNYSLYFLDSCKILQIMYFLGFQLNIYTTSIKKKDSEDFTYEVLIIEEAKEESSETFSSINLSYSNGGNRDGASKI